MQLKVSIQKDSKHFDLVSCVSWFSSEELISAGDDHQVVKTNQVTGDSSVLQQLNSEVYATDLHCLPKVAGVKKQNEVYMLASTDGKVFFVSKTGRVEKTFEAHHGAVLSGRWNYSGNALATGGEDGQVKIWSRSGMLRSTLVSLFVPVYSIMWSPNSDSVLYTNGKQLVIKPLQPSSKAVQWKAHDGVILKVDWSAVNNLIVSGAEDCKYKVWDVFGRLLYSSGAHDYPITSVAWNPDGELFAVGSYNTLRLCDRAGWSYALEKPATGSLFNITWASDGTQIAGACGNGQLLVAHITERCVEWKNLEVVISEQKLVKVKDVLTNAREDLDFRNRVVKLELGYDHLVVTTPFQCYIYSVNNWNTPIIFDLKATSVYMLKLAEKHFLIVDETGIQVHSYEGQLVCSPRYNIQGGILSKHFISLSNDTIAVRDRMDDKALYFFEAFSGKPLGDGKPTKHSMEIVQIALNQVSASSHRQLAFIDKNEDLFLRSVNQFGGEQVVKLIANVSSMCWNDTCNMLATVSDHKLRVWYQPSIAFIDQELVTRTVHEKEQGEFGKDINLLSFVGCCCTMRRGDGALCSTSISAYPIFLHKHVDEGNWNGAVRLCRSLKDDSMWACLAGMATSQKDLSTAEIAYSAIEEVEKVQFVNYIRDIPSAEVRNAATDMFCGRYKDAETALLQNGLIYRAIQMYIDRFNWDRALEIAVKYKTHVDTVLAFRERYLKRCNKTETSKKFIQFSQGVSVDWEKVKAKIDMELDKERS